MSSQLNVDTIVDKAGSGGTNVKIANNAVTVSEGGNATTNTVQGLAKVWIKYTDHIGDGAGLAIADDLNVSTVADTGSGQVTVNFTNNMTSTNFCYHVTAMDMASRMLGHSGYIQDATSTYISTSKLLVQTAYVNNTDGGIGFIDSDLAMVTIDGDLA